MRKFLVIVDDTPECTAAIEYAGRRAMNTGGQLVMLFITRPEEFQHWIGVGQVMQQEARETAERRFEELCGHLRKDLRLDPEMIIREGEPAQEILAQIAEDPEIGVLVLGASVDGEGPGPLVTQMAGRMAGKMPVPVTVVPGSLSVAQIDEIT